MSAKCMYYWRKKSDIVIKCMKCSVADTKIAEERRHFPVLFVIIPGNPGCVKFYERFSEVLCNSTNIPVWGISHTGHEKSEPNLPHPAREHCGLQEQIKHKIEYLREEVFPVADKVILIGHSIGCYVILHILDKIEEDENKIYRSILLFPTIEKMRFSPQGKIMTPALSYARWAFVLLSGLVAMLPSSLVHWLLPMFVQTETECITNTVKENLSAEVTNSMTLMALHEMYEVDLRDDRIIEQHVDKLVFYYGKTDHWCPLSYYEEVKSIYSSYEGNNIMLCNQNIPHAFVIKRSEDMAKLVATMIEA